MTSTAKAFDFVRRPSPWPRPRYSPTLPTPKPPLTRWPGAPLSGKASRTSTAPARWSQASACLAQAALRSSRPS